MDINIYNVDLNIYNVDINIFNVDINIFNDTFTMSLYGLYPYTVNRENIQTSHGWTVKRVALSLFCERTAMLTSHPST